MEIVMVDLRLLQTGDGPMGRKIADPAANGGGNAAGA
jgi:hypothetical protein